MSLTLFIIPQLVVRIVFKEPRINSTILYLVFAFCLPLLWIFLPRELLSLREVNFIQHAVGGGVAVGFVSIYFIQNFKERFSVFQYFPFQILFVYALVSMFGAANELLEFLLDWLKIGIFSSDRYDTWYDLLANTSGAFAIYLVMYVVHKFWGHKSLY